MHKFSPGMRVRYIGRAGDFPLRYGTEGSVIAVDERGVKVDFGSAAARCEPSSLEPATAGAQA